MLEGEWRRVKPLTPLGYCVRITVIGARKGLIVFVRGMGSCVSNDPAGKGGSGLSGPFDAAGGANQGHWGTLVRRTSFNEPRPLVWLPSPCCHPIATLSVCYGFRTSRRDYCFDWRIAMLFMDVLIALILLAAPFALVLLPSLQPDLKPVPVRVRARQQRRR